MKKNIQVISDNFLCSACGACNVICPKNAIRFEWSNMGRKYAMVNENECVNCGMCTKVCPSLDYFNLRNNFEDLFVGDIAKTYIGRASDFEVYKNAQSGGVCTAILSHLFEVGKIDAAIVCKMSYGKRPLVEGIVVEKISQLAECQKSCYTPVDVLSALKKCGEKKSIALVGIPCQIEGAINLQRVSSKFHNISYRIGLVCDGVMGATAMDVMTSFQDEENVRIEWKKKCLRKNGIESFDYTNAPVCVCHENGSQCIIPKRHRVLIKDMFVPPRCRLCYDKLNIHADIVLGDPWGMSGYDRVHGDNVVVARTALGESLIEEMNSLKKISLKEVSFSDFTSGQKIELRRQLVSSFSNALKRQSVETYLYEQNYVPISKDCVKKARAKENLFLKCDKMDGKAIVQIARKKIFADQGVIRKIGRFIKGFVK